MKASPTPRFGLPKSSLIAALIATAHSTAYAAGIWDGGVGNFNVATNWDNDVVPVGINTVVNNGGTIQVTDIQTTNDILAGTVTGGVGTWSQSAGTLSMGGGWFRLGTVTGGVGTFNLSGGTLNTVGEKNIGEAPGGTGIVNLSGTGVWANNGGGAIAIGGRANAAAAGSGVLTVADSAQITSNTEFRVGCGTGAVGTMSMSGGTVTNNGWFVVGRSSGTGTLTMSGGTINKAGGGDFIVGSLSGQGTVNHSGGTINNTGSRTLLGETAGSNTYNLSGTGVANFGQLTLSFVGAANGTFNLNGDNANRGELNTTLVNKLGTGTGIFNFNGGRMKASAASATFMQGLNRANVRNNGALIDTNTFGITIAQPLLHSDIGGDAAVDGGLQKNGAGTLTLAGANTFTGDTVINAGTLALNNAAALAGSALNYDNQGGTLSFGSLTAATFGGLKGAQNLALTNGSAAAVALTLGANNVNNTYAGVLSGGGSLIKTGTGVQTLTGNQTYTGGTTINAGALSVAAITQLPGSGTGTTVAAGAVLAAPASTDINAFRASLGNVTFNAGSFIGVDTSAGDFEYSGNIAPTGYAGDPGFAKVGPNTLTLTGNNTYTGGTRVSGGTLIVGSANALGAGGSLTSANGGRIDFNGFPLTRDHLVLSGGSVDNTGGASALSLSTTGDAITVTGTYAFASPAVTTAVPINLTGASGGNIIKATTFGNPVLAGDLDLGGQVRTIALADTGGDAFPEMTLSGVIGNGGLTLDNTFNGTSTQEWGSLLLSGANTYDGPTQIAVGRLEITNEFSLGTTAAGTTIGTRGTLAFGGSGQTIGSGINVAEPLSINRTVAGTYGLIAVQNNSGNNSLTGPISLDATAEFNVGGGNLYLDGIVSETAPSGLTKSGGAVLTLNNANTYSGLTTVTGGELFLFNAGALGTTAAGSLVTGGRITVGGGLTITGEPLTINGNGVNLGGALQAAPFDSGTWDADVTLGSVDAAAVRIGAGDSGVLTVNGVIKNGTGGILDISGLAGTGTVVLKGANTYTGLTNVIRGNLVVDGGGSISSGAGVTVGGNGAGEQTSLTVQNNGSVLGDTINVALNNVPQNANWTQGGGLVSTKAWFIIGHDGTGTANGQMTGGVMNVKTVADPGTQSFEIGTFGAVSGTFTMSGSAEVNLLNNGYLILGGQTNTGTNTFNQDGGTVTYYTDGGTTAGGNRALILGGGTATANCTYNLNAGTLTVPAVTRESTALTGSGVFNFNGGLLVPTAGSASFVGNLTRVNVRDGGARIDTDGFDVTVTQSLDHSDVGGDASVDGGLTKEGAGTLTLAAANSYTGDTLVNQGTLALQSASALDDLSSLRMDSSDSTLALDHAGTETVYRFYVDGSPLAAGTYVEDGTQTGGEIGSPLIVGSGKLQVVNDGTSTPFQTWATTTKGLAGANALPGADPDMDGLSNLLEFILGGEPNPANPGSNNLAGLAATVEKSGGNHVFSFRRSQVSATQPGLTIVYEYGLGLDTWDPATDVGTVSAPVVDFYGAGIDKIEVTIPDTAAAPDGRLFVRMNANLAE